MPTARRLLAKQDGVSVEISPVTGWEQITDKPQLATAAACAAAQGRADAAYEAAQACEKAETGSGWIRYQSGLQLCWGVTGNLSAATSVSYGKPFSGAPNVTLTPNKNAVVWATGVVGGESFTVNASEYAQAPAVRWLAVGWWK